jgi:hypothetical protein
MTKDVTNEGAEEWQRGSATVSTTEGQGFESLRVPQKNKKD